MGKERKIQKKSKQSISKGHPHRKSTRKNNSIKTKEYLTDEEMKVSENYIEL